MVSRDQINFLSRRPYQKMILHVCIPCKVNTQRNFVNVLLIYSESTFNFKDPHRMNIVFTGIQNLFRLRWSVIRGGAGKRRPGLHLYF